jgi:hypothetical protein
VTFRGRVGGFSPMTAWRGMPLIPSAMPVELSRSLPLEHIRAAVATRPIRLLHRSHGLCTNSPRNCVISPLVRRRDAEQPMIASGPPSGLLMV